MINNISESALRVASKIDPSGVIHEKEMNQEKARKIRETRPVEKSDAGDQTQAKKARNDEVTSKFLMNGKRVVFEKYDKEGKVVLRIPPSEAPVDQVA